MSKNTKAKFSKEQIEQRKKELGITGSSDYVPVADRGQTIKLIVGPPDSDETSSVAQRITQQKQN